MKLRIVRSTGWYNSSKNDQYEVQKKVLIGWSGGLFTSLFERGDEEEKIKAFNECMSYSRGIISTGEVGITEIHEVN